MSDLEVTVLDPFYPLRTAYRQRVRVSALTLVPLDKPHPASMDVCWYCLDHGDLNEAINEITIQAFLQGETFDEVIAKLKTPKPDESAVVSEHELLELEDTLRREMLLAEMLESEHMDVEMQLKTAVATHTVSLKTCASVKHGVQLAQDSLTSLEVKLSDLERQLKLIPTSDYEIWEQFFQIEDHFTFATICGIPLACNPSTFDTSTLASSSTVWNASKQDAQNISAAMVMVSCLLGRLMNSLPTARPDWFEKRRYRVVTTPAAVETRSSGAEAKQVFHLTPFVNEKETNWHKGLLLLAELVALMYRYWKQAAPYQIPESLDSNYYVLDLTKPHQWNEKMRQLLLSIKQLIALRFPPPSQTDLAQPSSSSLS